VLGWLRGGGGSWAKAPCYCSIYYCTLSGRRDAFSCWADPPGGILVGFGGILDELPLLLYYY